MSYSGPPLSGPGNHASTHPLTSTNKQISNTRQNTKTICNQTMPSPGTTLTNTGQLRGLLRYLSYPWFYSLGNQTRYPHNSSTDKLHDNKECNTRLPGNTSSLQQSGNSMSTQKIKQCVHDHFDTTSLDDSMSSSEKKHQDRINTSILDNPTSFNNEQQQCAQDQFDTTSLDNSMSSSEKKHQGHFNAMPSVDEQKQCAQNQFNTAMQRNNKINLIRQI